MANAVEIVISASDRASGVVAGINSTIAGIGTTINSRVIPAFTAFSTAVIGAVGVARTGFLQIIDFIERTDSLLRRFANTTLQDVVLGAVQSLVEGISDATEYSLTEVAGAIAQISKLSLGFGNQPALANAVTQAELQSEKIKAFAEAVGAEYDLVALKIEQFGAAGVDVGLEFEKAKQRVEQLGKSLGVDVGVEADLLALKFQTLGENLGLSNSFDAEFKSLNQIAGTELDLLELKLEQFAAGAGISIEREFDKSKSRIQQIAGAIGEDATEQLQGLAEGLNSLAGEKGLSLSFDPAPVESAVQQTQATIGQLLQRAAAETAASVSQSVGFLVNNFDKAFFQLSGIVQNNVARIQSAFDLVSQATFSFSGADEVLGLFDDLQRVVAPAVQGLASVGQQIIQIQGLLGALQPIIASGPFHLLIQQNIQLREQLLSTQATLASTNKVFQGGVQITDPGQAIKALQAPVEGAIDRIRQGALQLAGVTSGELIDSFRIISSQVGNLGIGINDAANLTLDFAAGLTTLGIPLYQAQQEISSILTGQIDQNSVLAKALNITNEQVQTYQTQGKLVDFLTKKLAGFRAGNVELANTFSGVTSNIQEVIELIGLAAGKNLLDPIVAQLNKVYEYLNQNREQITVFVQDVAEGLLGAVENLADSLGSLFGGSEEVLGNSIRVIFAGITGAIDALAGAIKTASVVFQPFLAVLGSLSSLVPGFLTPLIAVSIQAKVLGGVFGLLTGGFERFAKGIPFVGELLFLMEQRSSGLIGLLTGLTSATSAGAAGFLTLGANLNKVPGLLGLVANRIPIFGTQIASVIPLISQFGIAGIAAGQKLEAIAEKTPLLKVALDGVKSGFTDLIQGKGGGGIPAAIDKIVEFSKTSDLLKPFAPAIEEVGGKIRGLATTSDLAAVANKKFADTTALLREQLITAGIRIGLITGGIYLAVAAFDKYILQNKQLLDFLGKIGQGLSSFAKDITNFLISPFGLATIAIGGATTALIVFGNTIRAEVVSNALPGLIAGLGRVIGLLTSMSSIAKVLGASQFAAVFTRSALAVSALSASAATGTVTLGGLSAALAGVAASAALALAPIAAIAAGIALIGIARYTDDLAESTEATEIYARTTDVAANAAIQLQQVLKTNSDQQKKQIEEGRALTDAQVKQNAALKERARLQSENLTVQIAALEIAKQEAVGDNNKAALQGQIDLLTKLKTQVDGYAQAIDLAGDPVFVLGNRVKFLDQQLKRLEGSVDADQKEAIAKLTKGLQDGVATQEQVEDQKVEITRAGYQKQLAETEKGLKELQERYNKLTAEEKERALDIQDAINKDRAAAADLRTKIVESELQEQQTKIDRAANKALQVSEAAETQRATLIQRLRNNQRISEADARQFEIDSNKQKIKEELAIEQDRLKELSKNPKANEEAIKASRKKILDLTLQSLKAEEEAYNAYIGRVKEALDRQVTDREIALQRSINSGLTTEKRAEQERARTNVARLQAELRAETKNADRRRELTLQLAQAERQLQEANLGVLEENLTRQTQAFENQIKEQNTQLQAQIDLYEAAGQALEIQKGLLTAQRDLLSAAEGYVTGQVRGIAELENSEIRRQQLAQTTALIQLESLQQRQETERQIFEIQQEQNRLALERQQIENEIALAQKEAEIARGRAQVIRAGEQLRTGQISQQEFDATVAELQANQAGLLSLQRQGALIQNQQAIQPQQEAAARQQFELQQRGQLTNGLVELYRNLRPGQQAQVRQPLQDIFAQQAGFSSSRDLRQAGAGNVQDFLRQIASGGGAIPGTDFFRQLTPRSQAIAAGLEKTSQLIPTQTTAIDLSQTQFSAGLQQTLQSLDTTLRQSQIQAARPLPTLALPQQLPNIEALRQQALRQQQQQAPSLTATQINAIADAYWQRFSGFGDGVTRDPRMRVDEQGGRASAKVEAPITVNVTAPPDQGAMARQIGTQVGQELRAVITRASQIAK